MCRGGGFAGCAEVCKISEAPSQGDYVLGDRSIWLLPWLLDFSAACLILELLFPRFMPRVNQHHIRTRQVRGEIKIRTREEPSS